MSTSPAKGAAELGAAPLNFIYACSVCYASFADVYEGHHETVRGLSDGINPKDRLVTRVFLASCCHVFCSSHIEGGGPPFHRAGQQPKAPCPICIKEKGDSSKRELYSIRGFHKDEYDPHIPPSWFTAPPIRLDGSGKEMEALRFQYIALIRYCQNTHAARKPLQNALLAAETKLASMQDLASREHAKVLSLQQENEQLRAENKQLEVVKAELERLQGSEQEMERFRRLNVNSRDLETFIENKTAIRHYLKLVPQLLDQNEQMQKRLAKLGFAMALEPISKFTGIDPHALDSDEDYAVEGNDNSAAFLRKTASSHTAGRSVHTSGRPGTASSGTFFHRPLKRQRLHSPLPNKMQMDHHASKEAMPPPSKPLSRMNSVRKLFPSLRKKFSNGHATPVMEKISESTSDVRVNSDNHIQDNTFNQHQSRENLRSETPYMSGALPILHPSKSSERRDSQLLSSVGIHDNRSDFTFRASSPIKMDRLNNNRGSPLPTEPSYMRLMDGLSSDNGVELGLKDPREAMVVEYQHDGGARQVMHNYWDEQDLQEAGYQRHWDLEHPFVHQSPRGPSTSAVIHQQNPSQQQTNRHTNRTYNQPLGLVTPAPRRQRSPGQELESVVSPHFRNGHNQAHRYPQSGLAERQGSSTRSGVCLSQRPRMGEPQLGWHEPRSLNGLSFFDSPVNSRNEPIETGHRRRLKEIEPISPSDHCQSRHINSHGYITRPGNGSLPYANDGAYSSSRNIPSYARQAPTYTRTRIDLPYSDRPSYSRIEPALSSMPSSVPRRSPSRTQSQWENLQRAGVRSSRNAFSSSAQQRPAASQRDIFQSSGRRSVRR